MKATPKKKKPTRRKPAARDPVLLKIMDHVHPFVWSLCALIFVLGHTISATLDDLGFNVSAPANRIASAYARGYELQIERGDIPGVLDGGELLGELQAIREKLEAQDARFEQLESMAHPPGPSQPADH